MAFDNIETISFNDNLLLSNLVNNEIGWVTKNTAVLVFHGIGYQLPLETIDMFGRGLIKQYKAALGDSLVLTHEIVIKKGSTGQNWFDNVLRISNEGSPFYIDIYEYYWANYTEDKTGWSDLNNWVQGVVKGARQFYKANSELGKVYKDRSIFFRKSSGKFISWKYRLVLTMLSQLFVIWDSLVRLLILILSYVPFVGYLAKEVIDTHSSSATKAVTNLLGDVTAYNVVDPKSKFYNVHKRILEGGLNALLYVVEKTAPKKSSRYKCIPLMSTYNKSIQLRSTLKLKQYTLLRIISERTYPAVVVAAHSLGSQIAYDAINKLNFEINKGVLSTYNDKGVCKLGTGCIQDQMKGFITFGSPLDKIIFFLRENIPEDAYLRRQFLNDFHGFKQRDMDGPEGKQSQSQYTKSECNLKRLLDDMQWRNYYDDKDYVSGPLDYYKGLTNINCRFKAGKYAFTHSYYWMHDKFYADIISNFLT